jgi:hypothetical protein
MKTFKTQKGTELRISDIKGKDYLGCDQRIIWFREVYPQGHIMTEIIPSIEGHTTFKATVIADSFVLANAHKTLKLTSVTDYEKAETMAIGRALALCGFGTQFCGDDLDEGEHVADSPREPGPVIEDVATAYFEGHCEEPIPDFDSLPKTKPDSIIEKSKQVLKNLGTYVIPIGQWKGKTFDDIVEEHDLGQLKSKYYFWAKDPKGDNMKKLVDNLKMFLESRGERL